MSTKGKGITADDNNKYCCPEASIEPQENQSRNGNYQKSKDETYENPHKCSHGLGNSTFETDHNHAYK